MNAQLAERIATFAKRGTLQGFLGRTGQFAVYVRDGEWLAFNDDNQTPLATHRTEAGLRGILTDLER